jgi:hypothetical protein
MRTAERRRPPPLHDSNLEDADAVVDASATRKKKYPSDMIVIIFKSRREAGVGGGMADRRWAWPADVVCAHTHALLILFFRRKLS